MPVAIAQYPDYFNENRWLLPLSVACVGALWITPLLIHENAKGIAKWIWSRGLSARILGIISPLVLIAMLAFSGWRLLRSHTDHLNATLAAKIKSPQKPEQKTSVEFPSSDHLLNQMARDLGEIRNTLGSGEKPSPSFAAAIDTMLFSPADRTIGIYVGYDQTLFPAKLGLHIRLTNLQPVATMVARYGVEMGPRKQRMKLIRLSTPGTNAYFVANDLRSALWLDDQTLIDNKLAGKNLQSRETVEGWAFFEYPPKVYGVLLPLTVTILDVAGESFTSRPLNPSTDPANESVQSGTWGNRGRRDISAFRIKNYNDPMM